MPITLEEFPNETFPDNTPKEKLRQMIIERHPEMEPKLKAQPPPDSGGGIMSPISAMVKRGLAGANMGGQPPTAQDFQKAFQKYEPVGKPAMETAGAMTGAGLFGGPGLVGGPMIGRGIYRGLEGKNVLPQNQQEWMDEFGNVAWDATLGILLPKGGKIMKQSQTYQEALKWLVGGTSKYPENLIKKNMRVFLPSSDVDSLYQTAKRFDQPQDMISVQPIRDAIQTELGSFKMDKSNATKDLLEDLDDIMGAGSKSAAIYQAPSGQTAQVAHMTPYDIGTRVRELYSVAKANSNNLKSEPLDVSSINRVVDAMRTAVKTEAIAGKPSARAALIAIEGAKAEGTANRILYPLRELNISDPKNINLDLVMKKVGKSINDEVRNGNLTQEKATALNDLFQKFSKIEDPGDILSKMWLGKHVGAMAMTGAAAFTTSVGQGRPLGQSIMIGGAGGALAGGGGARISQWLRLAAAVNDLPGGKQFINQLARENHGLWGTKYLYMMARYLTEVGRQTMNPAERTESMSPPGSQFGGTMP